MCVSIFLSIYLYNLYTSQAFDLFFFLLFIYRTINLPNYTFMYPSIYLPIYPFMYVYTQTTNDVSVIEPLLVLGLACISYYVSELFHWSGKDDDFYLNRRWKYVVLQDNWYFLILTIFCLSVHFLVLSSLTCQIYLKNIEPVLKTKFIYWILRLHIHWHTFFLLIEAKKERFPLNY